LEEGSGILEGMKMMMEFLGFEGGEISQEVLGI